MGKKMEDQSKFNDKGFLGSLKYLKVFEQNTSEKALEKLFSSHTNLIQSFRQLRSPVAIFVNTLTFILGTLN